MTHELHSVGDQHFSLASETDLQSGWYRSLVMVWYGAYHLPLPTAEA